MSPIARTLARLVALGVWTALVVLGVTYGLHLVRVHGLRRDDVPSLEALGGGRLDPAVVRLVGTRPNEQASAYHRRPTTKRPGVVRICAFGDSFTAGDEVGPRLDYPSLLEREFDGRAQRVPDPHGPGEVEVLNFGSSWFGFHQTYLLWERVGAGYGCDHVLLGPGGFFPERETSFNHSGRDSPYYLHARYVMDGEDVRLVEVIGDTTEERFEEYHRFVPPEAYLRYDTRPPAFLLAWLPRDRTMPNPFYYWSGRDPGSVALETRATYQVLLRRLAASGPEVVLGGPSWMAALARSLAHRRLHAFAARMPMAFPYLAPRGHQGPLGNGLLAKQYFAQLVGAEGATLVLLRSEDLVETGGPATPGSGHPVSGYQRITVELDGTPVGHFATGARHRTRSGAGVFRNGSTVSLLHVTSPEADRVTGGASILDGCFVALERPLSEGEKATLRVEGSAGERTGHVRLLRRDVNVGTIVTDATSGGASASGFPAASLRRARRATLVLGDAAPARISLRPDDCWRLRASRQGFVDVDALGPAGVYELVLRHAVEGPTRVPVARWTKVQRSVAALAPPLERPVRAGVRRRRAAERGPG